MKKIATTVKQGNRGDMQKIHVTRQFLEKTKNPFLDKVNGSMCAKFQICIVFRLARRRDTHTYMSRLHKICTVARRPILPKSQILNLF